ncbi:MAG: hypothetical protein GY810_28470 [Aureispira sp.]|nr:hypothetical protein [Aureispira sp.]
MTISATARTVNIFRGLTGKTLNSNQIASIIDNYINYRDVMGYTEEEKAQKFIDKILFYIKHQVKTGANRLATELNSSVVAEAVESSVIDL